MYLLFLFHQPSVTTLSCYNGFCMDYVLVNNSGNISTVINKFNITDGTHAPFQNTTYGGPIYPIVATTSDSSASVNPPCSQDALSVMVNGEYYVGFGTCESLGSCMFRIMFQYCVLILNSEQQRIV